MTGFDALKHSGINAVNFVANSFNNGKKVINGAIEASKNKIESVNYMLAPAFLGIPNNLSQDEIPQDIMPSVYTGLGAGVLGLLHGNFISEATADIIAVASVVSSFVLGHILPPEVNTIVLPGLWGLAIGEVIGGHRHH